MSIPSAWPQVPHFFGAPLVIERSPDQLSGDAGPLPVGLSDRGVGFARASAAPRRRQGVGPPAGEAHPRGKTPGADPGAKETWAR
jgi:hypothetical protein